MSNSLSDYLSKPKEVAVFGAGITGLTVAHELVERGYKVEVYEMRKPSIFERIDGVACGVGGMAHTQWERVDRPLAAGPMFSTQQLRLLPDARIKFRKNSTRFAEPAAASDALQAVVKELLEAEAVKLVEVRGHCDQRGAVPYENYRKPERIDWQRALAVKEQLRKLLSPELKKSGRVLELKPVAMGLGFADDWSRPDAERDFVSFHIVEDWVPGEHGFRFFPSFYRNLFDSMRRTPVAKEDRPMFEESPRTVLDNVVPTPFQGLGTSTAKAPSAFRRRTTPSVQAFFDELCDLLKAMGLTLSDVARFQLKMFKYMTSCKARRADYEQMSWWNFLEAEQFSPGAQKYIETTTQTALAMTARQCDARTYGTIAAQMLHDQFDPAARVDGTLNGPASQVWFDHWRRYLEAQGVEFRRGVLDGFEFFDGQVWPMVIVEREQEDGAQRPRGKAQEEEHAAALIRDYYVLALPAHVLQGLARDYPELYGEDFERLRSFPLGVRTAADSGGGYAHMSGIQYYFNSDIRILEGHSVYPDSPWRLSAIAQPQFWMEKRGWWSGYRGVLSVDISDWSNPGGNGRCAWECTRDEIAREAWAQIRSIAEKQLAAQGLQPRHLPDPVFYHLDDGIVFGRPGSARPNLPNKNRMPYLTNRPGQYRRRPGQPGNYRVHFNKLVLAGVLMQTHTRLTSMEAANESARYAVNAILDADLFEGERCSVANPEDYEPADLRLLVELDEQLRALDLPHFADILDLREVPRALLRPDPDLQALGLEQRLAKQ
ncbi:MAG: NAD(P)-binding protein [Deltaproteobacteria bacterium]|nr:NAD(P)-binding protein [Deltaproteobacteria bacterium]